MSSVSVPDDVLMEILAYVPGKSLSRFKCVCKGWILLIENCDFIAKHHQTQVARNNNGCILVKRSLAGSRYGVFSLLYSKGSAISCEDLVLPSTVHKMGFVRLIGPCKSLFCANNERSSDITIWNPATNEYKLLPSSPVPDSPPNILSQWASIGFGFDSITNDYKVVRIWYVILRGHRHLSKVEVWNLRDNSWRQLNIAPPVLISRYSKEHVYKDGKFYWWGADDQAFDDNPDLAENPGMIVSFDISNEVFKGIEAPAYHNVNVGMSFWGEMLELNGSICLCTRPEDISERRFEIWMMNGCGEDITWSKYMTIEIPVGVPLRPYGFWKNGEILLGDAVMVSPNGYGPVISYDPLTKGIIDLGVSVCALHQVMIYNESLAPIK